MAGERNAEIWMSPMPLFGPISVESVGIQISGTIVRELRLATQRAKLVQLPLYAEQRRCKHPTTDQILPVFSLAERHTLRSTGCTIQVLHTDLTDLQRQLRSLLGVSAQAFQSKDPLRN